MSYEDHRSWLQQKLDEFKTKFVESQKIFEYSKKEIEYFTQELQNLSTRFDKGEGVNEEESKDIEELTDQIPETSNFSNGHLQKPNSDLNTTAPTTPHLSEKKTHTTSPQKLENTNGEKSERFSTSKLLSPSYANQTIAEAIKKYLDKLGGQPATKDEIELEIFNCDDDHPDEIKQRLKQSISTTLTRGRGELWQKTGTRGCWAAISRPSDNVSNSVAANSEEDEDSEDFNEFEQQDADDKEEVFVE